MSDSLPPCGLQHARLFCPSITPGTCSNSCPLSQWYHPTISSSVIPFSSCLKSFPASGSFPMSQFFASGGQSIGTSASASVLPMNIQGLICFMINWFDLLAVQGTLKSLFQHHNWKALILGFSAFFVFPLRCSFAHHQHFHQHGRYSLSLLCWQSMCSLSAQGLFPRLPSLPGSST